MKSKRSKFLVIMLAFRITVRHNKFVCIAPSILGSLVLTYNLALHSINSDYFTHPVFVLSLACCLLVGMFSLLILGPYKTRLALQISGYFSSFLLGSYILCISSNPDLLVRLSLWSAFLFSFAFSIPDFVKIGRVIKRDRLKEKMKEVVA